MPTPRERVACPRAASAYHRASAPPETSGRQCRSASTRLAVTYRRLRGSRARAFAASQTRRSSRSRWATARVVWLAGVLAPASTGRRQRPRRYRRWMYERSTASDSATVFVGLIRRVLCARFELRGQEGPDRQVGRSSLSAEGAQVQRWRRPQGKPATGVGWHCHTNQLLRKCGVGHFDQIPTRLKR